MRGNLLQETLLQTNSLSNSDSLVRGYRLKPSTPLFQNSLYVPVSLTPQFVKIGPIFKNSNIILLHTRYAMAHYSSNLVVPYAQFNSIVVHLFKLRIIIPILRISFSKFSAGAFLVLRRISIMWENRTKMKMQKTWLWAKSRLQMDICVYRCWSRLGFLRLS